MAHGPARFYGPAPDGDLKRGQKAMAMAMLYPEPDPPGRGKVGKARE
jgi:hypothetical protein